MGIPSTLTLHLEPLHRLVPAYQVLQRPADDVVDTRKSVCTGRALVKHKRRRPFSELHTHFKSPLRLPFGQYFLADGGQIQLLVFLILVGHRFYMRVYRDCLSRKITHPRYTANDGPIGQRTAVRLGGAKLRNPGQ